MALWSCFLLKQLEKWRAWLQATASKLMGAAFFRVITQRVVEIPYCLFGTTNRVQFIPFTIGPIRRSETSVGNYHYSLRNNSEERSSHKRYKLHIFDVIFVVRGTVRVKWSYSERNIAKFEKPPFAVNLKLFPHWTPLCVVGTHNQEGSAETECIFVLMVRATFLLSN